MSVTRLVDPHEIRRRLERDRHWALYALADLDAEMFAQSDWWAGPAGSVALVFRGLSITPIVAIGNAEETRQLLAAIDEPAGYLNLLPHQLEAATGLYEYRSRHEMRRMFVDTVFRPWPAPVVSLHSGHADEIQALYDTGSGSGIAFSPSQLATGMFRGIRSARGALLSVAGVHVLSRQESVAGVGNVFTHPSCRNRGYARAVTSAVVAALLDASISTIGLNVEHDNAPAIRAYAQLGFTERLRYYEGVAVRTHRQGGLRDETSATASVHARVIVPK